MSGVDWNVLLVPMEILELILKLKTQLSPYIATQHSPGENVVNLNLIRHFQKNL